MLPLKLTIEQQFALTTYKAGAKSLTAEQATELLIEALRQGMVKDNIICHLMKNEASQSH